NPNMITVKADDKRRVVLPDIKPGQIFAFTPNPDGTITLSPVKAVKRKAGILDGLKPLTKEECAQCWGPEAGDAENDRIAAAMSKASFSTPEELE
ncbi:MAG TPA: hypothetical protein VFB72_00265, partial [Verrucomicrobiae bacterium]|nr:hypothetical protein [Verrucomicrobiae bacterium]